MEMKDQAFQARKEAFVVASGAIHQRKCAEVAVEASERWRLQ